MVDLSRPVSILATSKNRFGISLITGFPMSSGQVLMPWILVGLENNLNIGF